MAFLFTMNMQSQALTNLASQTRVLDGLRSVDYLCLQELPINFPTSGARTSSVPNLAVAECTIKRKDFYIGRYPHSSKTSAVLGNKDLGGDMMENFHFGVIHAHARYPDVVRPVVGLIDTESGLAVGSIHAPSGKDECAKLSVLRFVDEMAALGVGSWFLVGDMNCTPDAFGGYFNLKSFKRQRTLSMDATLKAQRTNGSSNIWVVYADEPTQAGGRSLDFMITNSPHATVHRIAASFAADHLPLVFSI